MESINIKNLVLKTKEEHEQDYKDNLRGEFLSLQTTKKLAKAERLIEYALNHNVDYVYVLEDLLKILKGQDIKIDLKSYLD